MYRSLLVLALLALWGSSCNAPDFDDVGDETIRGQLFLRTDPFGVEAAQPATAKTVTIVDAEDSLDHSGNHIFSTKTDAEGYFKFTTLVEHKEYRVRYEEIIDGKTYYGDTVVRASGDNFTLNANLATDRQTGLILFTRLEDTVTASGVKHCLFASKSLADNRDKDCAGSLHQPSVNSNGYAGVFGLEAGTYWVRSSLTLPSGTSVVPDSITVPAGRVVRDTVSFPLPEENDPMNTVQVRAHDDNQAPLGGVRVCFFRSQSLYDELDCAGSNYQLVTDSRGTADTTNLEAATYYVLGELIIADRRWLGRDTIDLATDTVVDLTLTPH